MSNLAKRPEMPGVPAQPQPFVGPPRNQKVIDDNAAVKGVMDKMFGGAGGGGSKGPTSTVTGGPWKQTYPEGTTPAEAPAEAPPLTSTVTGGPFTVKRPPGVPDASAVNTSMRSLVRGQANSPFIQPETVLDSDTAAARLPEMPMPSTQGGMSGKSVNDAGAPPVPQFTSAVDSPMRSLVRGQTRSMPGSQMTDELQTMMFREPMGFDPVDVGIDTVLGAGIGGLGRLAGRTVAGAMRTPAAGKAGQTFTDVFNEFQAAQRGTRGATIPGVGGTPPAPVSFGPKPSTPAAVSFPPQAPRPVSMAPKGGNGTIPGAQWDSAATQVPGPRPVSMAPQGGRTMPGSQWDDASTLRPSSGGSTVPGSQWDAGATLRPRASTTIPDLSATVPPPGRVGPRPTPAPSPEQGQISSLLRRPSAPPQEAPLGPMPPAGPDQGFDLYDVTRWSGRGKDLLDQALRDNPGMMTRMSKDSVYAQQVLEHFEALGHKTGY